MGVKMYLILLVLAELSLCILSIAGKRSIRKEKCYVRAGALVLLAAGCLTGILQWGIRYYAVAILLLVQLLYGLIQCRKDWTGKTDNAGRADNVRNIGRAGNTDSTGNTGRTGNGKKIVLLAGNSFLYFLALIPALMFPEFTPPEVTGQYGVETAEYTWTDTERIETFTDTGEYREVTVKFWYPEESGKYPLVVFSHGAFGVIDSNISACTELASNGYVVASIGHPYHSMYLNNTEGKVTMADSAFIQSIYDVNANDSEEYSFRESRKWMALRTGDGNFVLDTILARAEEDTDALFSLIDTDKIGLFGHSMGGATCVELGRQRTDIDAVIDLEGTMFGEYTGVSDGLGIFRQDPYEIPLLDVYSEEIFLLAEALPENAYANLYMGRNAKCYDYVIFKGAGHLNFTDLPLVSPVLAGLLGTGSVDARTCIEDVNKMVLNFFDHYLKGKPDAMWKKEYGK